MDSHSLKLILILILNEIHINMVGFLMVDVILV